MKELYHYRISKNQKQEIAQNLINILKEDEVISNPTKRFIGDWILTGASEKRKVFYDVWDIVLKNYLPQSRPILFRACNRISIDGKIASFTGKLESAKRFSTGIGSLIICDTKETLEFEEIKHKQGAYENTFYPLFEVLEKEKRKGNSGFSDRLLSYTKECEYIMRIDLHQMSCVKWIKFKDAR